MEFTTQTGGNMDNISATIATLDEQIARAERRRPSTTAGNNDTARNAAQVDRLKVKRAVLIARHEDSERIEYSVPASCGEHGDGVGE